MELQTHVNYGTDYKGFTVGYGLGKVVFNWRGIGGGGGGVGWGT